MNTGGFKAVIHSEQLAFPSQGVPSAWLLSTVLSSLSLGGLIAGISGEEARAVLAEKWAAEQLGSTRPGLGAVGDGRAHLNCGYHACLGHTRWVRTPWADSFVKTTSGKCKSSRPHYGRERGPNFQGLQTLPK